MPVGSKFSLMREYKFRTFQYVGEKCMKAKLNWFGLVGGILTILVVVFSVFFPWWQLTVSGNFGSSSIYIQGDLKANVSPVNTNFGFLGTSFTIPLITALNIVSLLSLVASGIVMLIYSVIPAKPYSKHLLGFAYKKPLFILIFFVVGLIAISLIVQAVVGVGIPLMGSTTATLTQAASFGVNASVLLSAGFQWPFWLAVIAAGLCIAARVYHKKVAIAQQPAATATPVAPQLRLLMRRQQCPQHPYRCSGYS